MLTYLTALQADILMIAKVNNGFYVIYRPSSGVALSYAGADRIMIIASAKLAVARYSGKRAVMRRRSITGKLEGDGERRGREEAVAEAVPSYRVNHFLVLLLHRRRRTELGRSTVSTFECGIEYSSTHSNGNLDR